MEAEAALRRAIRRRPDDWPNWLVFADVLTEAGDPRGELILLHHQRATGRFDSEERPGTQAAIRAIEERHERTWSSGLRPGRHALTWRHGFVTGVVLTEPDGGAVARFNAHPSALLHGVGLCIGLEPDAVAEIVAWPVLPELAKLELYHCSIGDIGAAILAGTPAVAGLLDLRLSENPIGPAGVRALAESPHLAHLETLDLSHNPLADADVGPLAVPGLLPNLRLLYLNGLGLAADTVRAIVNAHPGCTVSA